MLRFGRRRSQPAAFRYLAEDAASGYGDAADRLVRAVRALGVPLMYLGWPAGSSLVDPAARRHSRDPRPLDRAPRRAPTIAHVVPEHLPNIRRAFSAGPLISHTVWETDRLPAHWPALLNGADRVIVPTEWNRRVFVESGVETSVVVVPHVACDPVPGDGGIALGLPDDVVVFYTIGRWDQRKAPAAVIRAFLDAFTDDDAVALVVKTSPNAQFPITERWGQSSAINGTTLLEVARIVRDYPRPPPIRVEVGDWEPEQIAGLHTRGDCFVSLSHGEGWGIGAFDAAAYGNPVVMTGWGGQLEFLDPESAFLVDCDVVPVEHWDPRSYGREQRWAAPSLGHASELMREIADNVGEARRCAGPLRRRVLSQFAPARVAALLLDAVPELQPNPARPGTLGATKRQPRRRRGDDVRLVGLAVGPERPAFENWLQMAERYDYGFEMIGREVAEPFIPVATKWRLLLDYFASMPRDSIVFYLDASDAFVCDSPSSTLARYRSYGYPLVVGAEPTSDPTSGFHVPDPTWRILNTGAYVGEAGVVVDALREGYELEDWETFGRVCDQHAMTLHLQRPRNRHLATVDHRRVIVQNVGAAMRAGEYEQHRRMLERGEKSFTSSVHFFGDNGRDYNEFAELYGLAPEALQESGRFRSPVLSDDDEDASIVVDSPIPRMAHFVFGLRDRPEAFHLVHALAIRSCLEMVEPDEIIVHCHHLPFGPAWELVEPFVTVRSVTPVEAVKKRRSVDPLVDRFDYARHADFIRLDVLAEHGGLYADLDTLFIAPIPERLWRASFVIGREADVPTVQGAPRPALSNALMMAQPGSRFVEAWRAEIGAALDDSWANHSCFLAHELATRLPNDVHVEPQQTFHAFEPSRAGVALLLEHEAPRLEGVVSLHLAAHLWWDEDRHDFSAVHAGLIDEEFIRTSRSTYAIQARRFLPDRAEAS